MKPKKIIAMILSLLFAVAIMVQPILAWFYQYRTNLLLATGDVQLSVKGWYQVATDSIPLEYLLEMSEDTNIFSFRDVSTDNFIAFKFTVTNKKDKDAVLSVRFSDFSEHIVSQFSEFYNLRTSGGSITQQLEDKIYAEAESNTAKIATMLDNMYYEDVDGSIKEVKPQNPYTWKYANRQNIFENILLPGVTTDGSGTTIESSVTLYFVVRFNQTSSSTEEYGRWLNGYTDENSMYHPGFAQQRIANILNHDWDTLPQDDKTLANEYMQIYSDCEFRSISEVSVDGLSMIRLNLKYFEFVGDNART